MTKRDFLLLAALGGLLLSLHALLQHQDSRLDWVYQQIEGKFRTPLLTVQLKSPAQPEPGSPAILMVHGISASKSVLTQMAGELARWGSRCHIIDLPGHGASPDRFIWEDCPRAVEEVITRLQDDTKGQAAPPPLVLLGHSLGARLALQLAQRIPGISGVVAISPAAEPVTRLKPKHLLLLVGDLDMPFVQRAAAYIYEQATGLAIGSLEPGRVWENKGGSRRLKVLAWTEHTGGLFRIQSYREIRKWLEPLAPGQSKRMFLTPPSRFRLVLRFLYLLTLMVFLFPLFNGVIALLRNLSLGGLNESPANNIVPAPNPERHESARRLGKLSTIWIYGGSGTLSVCILLVSNPWEHLQLLGADYLSGFLCLTGVFSLAAVRPKLSGFGIKVADLFAVTIMVLLLLFFVAPLLTQHLIHTTLSSHRLWRFPLVCLSVFPFYLFDEWAGREGEPLQGRVQRLLFCLSNRMLLVLLMLLGFFVLHNGQYLINLILPGLFSLSLLVWLYATLVYGKTSSLMASSLFSSLATGWFLCTFFPQT